MKVKIYTLSAFPQKALFFSLFVLYYLILGKLLQEVYYERSL